MGSFGARPVFAQQVVTNPVQDALNYQMYISEQLARAAEIAEEKAEKGILEALQNAGAVAFKNAITFFVTKIAEDTATWIASGDEGQKPLFFTEGWGEYLQDVGESAAAEAVISFADEVGLGNICVSPEIAIDIALPSLGAVGVRGPRCSLDDIKDAWDVRDPAFLEKFTLSFSTGQNDLGVAVNFLNNLDALQAQKEKAAENERLDSAFKAVKTGISAAIQTPAFAVEKAYEGAFGNDELAKGVYTYTGKPIADAVDVFTKTLLAQYMKKLQSGFFSLADVVKTSDALGDARNTLLNPLSTSLSGRQAADAQFTNVFRPNLKQSDSFDILSEFTSCPSEVKYAGLYNCVLDSAFAQALQPSGESSYLTVRDAVNAGLLHGDWAFGFTDPGTSTEPSYLNGYAYSNMKKLRRARVVPVGWELAALKVRQVGQRYSLQDMLDAFTDPASPFFHLVDPDWVLKLPEMRCTARAPGQILLSGSASRVETCVDIQDCVVIGEDGQCQTWGYCTNEKRSWAFPAESCVEEFATCEQFSEPGEQNSDNLWLTKTLDYKGCSAQTAGCTWYAIAKSAVGEWRDDDRVYLNANAKECEAEDAGCNRYIRMVSGSNLLRNSSFEDDGGHNYVLGAGDSIASNEIPDGWVARSVTTALVETDVVNGAFAVSMQKTGTSGVCLPGLLYTAPAGSFEVGQQYTISGQVRTDQNTARDLRLSFQNIPFTITSVGKTWKAFSFTFVMPATTNLHTLVLGANTGACTDLPTSETVFYDAVQFEKGTVASSYRNYGTTNIVNLKNAPACTFEDVGCQTYKPLNDRSATSINAVATGGNLCPAECNGYDSFEQQGTDTEPAMFANFIPTTATTCTAEQVGCQEFTNLDEVARGGEGLEYYSDIRHCETPQPQCNTYYAWEGSDQTGYQLMTFNLLANNADGSGAPKTTDGSTTCDPADLNCRELIAQDGGRAFRDLTATITCSSQCVPLRGAANSVNQAQCESRLGSWDALAQRCVYQVLASESRSCSAQFAGCREYVGNTGRNVAIVFTEDFEDGDTLGWSTGVISTESTTVGGHSLKLGGSVSAVSATTQIAVQNLVPGKAYELALSAKASVSDFMNVTVWLGANKVSSSRLGGFVSNTTQWNTFTVGPFLLPANATGPYNLIIEVGASSTKPDQLSLFMDNLVVRQLKDSSFLVKNSWSTPNTCETNPPLDGGSAGRSMLGCKAYTVAGDSANRQQYLTGFARLCSQEKIGCEAVIDTKNSVAPYREVYQEADDAERVVSEDQVRYVVNRKEFACQSEVVGCSELGKPVINQQGIAASYDSVYLINNPDTYVQTLCKGEGLFCKQFQTSSGSVVYAKHPGAQQCEYREAPNSFPPRFAWFKVGSTEENPIDCLDAEQNSFVNRCPAEQVSCTQFLEPISNESFFYKKNTLAANTGECNGAVDWKDGCVLFDDVSIRAKTFKSGDQIDFTGTPDGCQTGDVGCNTNVLLKVNLDRACSQWVTGVSTSRFYDRNLSQFRTTSYGLGRCLEADPLNPNVCRVWDNSADKPVLTEGVYRTRDISWAGEDYSGYSIPNQYPVETLRQRSVDTDEDGNPSGFRLTRLTNPAGSCTVNADCDTGQVCRLSLNPTTAQFDGSCFVESGLDGTGTSVQAECRAYPETDSPFPSRLAVFAPPTDEKNPGQIIQKDQIFKAANIGHDGERVECSYHKVYYASSPRYYGLQTIPPNSIKVNGNVQAYARKDTFLGWEGYCLERDPSRLINGSQDQQACLTWYPIDVIQGTTDLNNTNLKSGYLAAANSEYYCVESQLAEYRTTQRICKGCPPGYNQIHKSQSSTCSGDNHWRVCEPVAGDGWYAYDGLHGNETLGIMCTKAALIQSPDNRNQAWTTRILGQQLPGSKEFFVKDLGWAFEQQNSPYGAIRTNAPRLEDLAQALIVRDPNSFIDDCKQCKAEPWMPYGTCEDDEPQKKGKLCPLTPNAGSPYALNADADPSLIDKEINGKPVVPVRKDNLLPDDAPQPYPGSETYVEGISRLQDLFAKSYGVWEWQGVQSVCVGTCQGGVNDGEFCASDDACGDPDTSITYTCVGDPVNKTTGTCVGGAKNSQTCTTTADCQFARTNTLHQCVLETGPNQDPNDPSYVCSSGPFTGQGCESANDCSETIADGVCSFDQRCQATDTDGNIVISNNSGAACNSTAECAAPGACRVDRCSTDLPGTVSNLCTAKKAGEACGTSSGTVNQYARLSVGQPGAGWDFAANNPSLVQEPIIHPIINATDSPSGYEEGAVTGFSLNGATNGVIAAQGGSAPVTVAFYSYNENGEQMPLRLVLVDWGDGSDPAESRGSFKNHKHVCRQFCSNVAQQGRACSEDNDCRTDADPRATCDPFNFGDSEEACTDDSATSNGYFTFSYTYTCEGSTPCEYTPSVLVRDNWGATTRVSFPGSVLVNPAP